MHHLQWPAAPITASSPSQFSQPHVDFRELLDLSGLVLGRGSPTQSKLNAKRLLSGLNKSTNMEAVGKPTGGLGILSSNSCTPKRCASCLTHSHCSSPMSLSRRWSQKSGETSPAWLLQTPDHKVIELWSLESGTRKRPELCATGSNSFSGGYGAPVPG